MAMMMIPGFMLDQDLWRDVEPALAQWEPVTHGVATEGDTLAEMAHALLKDAPPVFILVGFSMGGYIAREILRQAPERVEALILIATSARGDTDVQISRKQALASQPEGVVFRGLSTAAIASSLHPDNAQRSDLINRIQEMGQRLGAEVFRRQSLLERRDERHELATIGCPTLVIAGDRDSLRSHEEVRELHEGISGSIFVTIEGTGHMVPLEAPERLAEVINQWAEEVRNKQDH